MTPVEATMLPICPSRSRTTRGPARRSPLRRTSPSATAVRRAPRWSCWPARWRARRTDPRSTSGYRNRPGCRRCPCWCTSPRRCPSTASVRARTCPRMRPRRTSGCCRGRGARASHVWTPLPVLAHWVCPGAHVPVHMPAMHVSFMPVQSTMPPYWPFAPHVAEALPTQPGVPGLHGTQARQTGALPPQDASASTHCPPEQVSGVEPTQAVAPVAHAGGAPSASAPSSAASAGPSFALASPAPPSVAAPSLVPSLLEASVAPPAESLAEASFAVASPVPPPSSPPVDDAPPELPHAVSETERNPSHDSHDDTSGSAPRANYSRYALGRPSATPSVSPG